MENKTYTISEVAKMLNVSPATVSRSINNNAGVSPALRQKVLDFVEEIGYKPNVVAQSLSSGKNNMIALILGDIRNPFYADIAFFIQTVLNEYGYIVSTFNTEYSGEKERGFIQMAIQHNFSGLILLTAQGDENDKFLESLDMPIVLINRITESYKGNMVLLDNFQAGYIATRHLINLGHNNIGFIAGKHETSSAALLRFKGYKQALENYKLPYREEFCYFDNELKVEAGFAVGQKFLSSEAERPSALIAVNDMLAIGLLDCLNKNGVNVPEKVSVVGVDNVAYSGLSSIQLTTVDHHAQKMATEAARLIIQQIKYPELPPERIILEPVLVQRKTTASYIIEK